MSYVPIVSSSAKQDLRDIHRYILTKDGLERATYVIREIQARIHSLCEFPERGARPLELLEMGREEYREVHFKPYRIFYRIEGQEVRVFLIADGRRDMLALLRLRLLA